MNVFHLIIVFELIWFMLAGYFVWWVMVNGLCTAAMFWYAQNLTLNTYTFNQKFYFHSSTFCIFIHPYIVTSLHHISAQILMQHIQRTERTCSSSRSMTPSSSLNLGHSCQHLDYQLKLLPDPATLPSSRAKPGWCHHPSTTENTVSQIDSTHKVWETASINKI